MADSPGEEPVPGATAPGHPLRKACDSCHASKVRCAMDPSSAGRPCRRCAKNGGCCTFTFPGARRRPLQTKKQRIAKLEERVRDLLRENGMDRPEWLPRGSARTNRAEGSVPLPAPALSPPSTLAETTPPARPASRAADDVVDRGFLTLAEANELVHDFRAEIEGRTFGAWLPLNLTCSQLRESRPILWLGILCATAASLGREPNLARSLSVEMDKVLQKSLAPDATPSIEVLLTTHIYTLHHYEPTYDRLQLCMRYLDLATSMVTKLARSVARNPTVSEDPIIDVSRELLVWYWANIIIEMKSGRPSGLTYDDLLVQRSLERAENSQARIDQSLVAWVTLARINLETFLRFENGVDGTPDADAGQCERRLEEWIREQPPDILNDDLLLEYHCSFIRIYETNPRRRKNQGDLGASRRLPSLDVSSMQHDVHTPWREITPGCVTAAQEILNIFIEMDPKRVRCMAIVAFGRVFYALRLLFHATYRILGGVPSTISLSALKTNTYIEALQRALLLAADGSRNNAAATWLYALQSRLVPWYAELCKRFNLGAAKKALERPGRRPEAYSTEYWTAAGGDPRSGFSGANHAQLNLASARPSNELLDSFDIWRVDPEDIIDMYSGVL